MCSQSCEGRCLVSDLAGVLGGICLGTETASSDSLKAGPLNAGDLAVDFFLDLLRFVPRAADSTNRFIGTHRSAWEDRRGCFAVA